jgi:hypothetical protein
VAEYVAQVVEPLPINHEALSSNPKTTKKGRERDYMKTELWYAANESLSW